MARGGKEQVGRVSSTDKKEWRRPALRKLPIAATTENGDMNEGVGKGKGMSGPNPVS
jgi:hypothetical protein